MSGKGSDFAGTATTVGATRSQNALNIITKQNLLKITNWLHVMTVQ